MPGDRVETVDGKQIRYWEDLERVIADSLGHTLRFGIRRGSDAEERDVTPVRIERSGTLQRKETVGWIGVSPRFHLPEIGVLDPNSPAAQAGLKTFDFVTSINGARGRDLGGVCQGGRARRRLAAADQLPARRLFGGAVRAHRDPASGVGGGHPGRGLRRRRAPALRDRADVGRAVRVLGRAGQPRRPDRHPPRRSDPGAGRAAAAALGSAAPAAGGQPAAHVQDLLGVAGRAAARGVVPAGGALGAGRLSPGRGAPGVRRDESPGVEDRAAGAGAQPLRLRGHARVRAHRATSSWR